MEHLFAIWEEVALPQWAPMALAHMTTDYAELPEFQEVAMNADAPTRARITEIRRLRNPRYDTSSSSSGP